MSADNEALHALADELGTKIDERPRMYLSSMGPMPQDGSNIIVDWPAPSEALELPGHQLQLTRAVGSALLQIRNEARRRAANFWSILTFCGSAVVAAVGEYVMDNDLLRIGGGAAMITAGIALAAVNTPGETQTPQVREDIVPIRIEQR
jgi:hypothetical protein